jgi:hypothetical protein
VQPDINIVEGHIHYSTDFKYQEIEVNDPVPTAHWMKDFKKLLELFTLLLSKKLGHSILAATNYW